MSNRKHSYNIRLHKPIRKVVVRIRRTATFDNWNKNQLGIHRWESVHSRDWNSKSWSCWMEDEKWRKSEGAVSVRLESLIIMATSRTEFCCIIRSCCSTCWAKSMNSLLISRWIGILIVIRLGWRCARFHLILIRWYLRNRRWNSIADFNHQLQWQGSLLLSAFNVTTYMVDQLTMSSLMISVGIRSRGTQPPTARNRCSAGIFQRLVSNSLRQSSWCIRLNQTHAQKAKDHTEDEETDANDDQWWDCSRWMVPSCWIDTSHDKEDETSQNGQSNNDTTNDQGSSWRNGTIDISNRLLIFIRIYDAM